MVSRASKQEYHNKIIKALLKIANFEKREPSVRSTFLNRFGFAFYCKYNSDWVGRAFLDDAWLTCGLDAFKICEKDYSRSACILNSKATSQQQQKKSKTNSSQIKLIIFTTEPTDKSEQDECKLKFQIKGTSDICLNAFFAAVAVVIVVVAYILRCGKWGYFFLNTIVCLHRCCCRCSIYGIYSINIQW